MVLPPTAVVGLLGEDRTLSCLGGYRRLLCAGEGVPRGAASRDGRSSGREYRSVRYSRCASAGRVKWGSDAVPEPDSYCRNPRRAGVDLVQGRPSVSDSCVRKAVRFLEAH